MRVSAIFKTDRCRFSIFNFQHFRNPSSCKSITHRRVGSLSSTWRRQNSRPRHLQHHPLKSNIASQYLTCSQHKEQQHSGWSKSEGLKKMTTKSEAALSWELLQKQNAATSTAVIAALEADELFLEASERQAKAIRQRDDEDADKLAKGIKAAIAKKVLPGDLQPEPYKEIDVLGKTPDEVAGTIIKDIGEAAKTGCVIVMCGLSGTGKGTTVARLKTMLPNAQTWSNGNIFRSLTLLCAKWCAQQTETTGKAVPIEAALTPENLASFMKCLSFGKFAADGGFDTRIHSEELGVHELVGEVQNTLLRGPDVGRNIPTVAEQTQGEVVSFVSGALTQLAAAGKIVLLEGRSQTVDFVRTPYRYTLTLSDPLLVGKRRVAQVAAAEALKELTASEKDAAPGQGEPGASPSPNVILTAVRKALAIFKS